MTDYFDRVERKLIESTGQTYPKRPALRRSPSPFLRLPSLAMAAIVCVVAVVAVLASRPATPRRESRGARPSTGGLVMPAGVRASFVAFRRARRRGDELPFALTRYPPRGSLIDQSRLVFKTRRISLWFVPGTLVCLIDLRTYPTGAIVHRGAGRVCDSGSLVQTRGMDEFIASPRTGAPWLIAGVVPDGAATITVTLRDGSSFAVRPNAQQAFVHSLPGLVRRVVYAKADGVSHGMWVPRTGGAM